MTNFYYNTTFLNTVYLLLYVCQKHKNLARVNQGFYVREMRYNFQKQNWCQLHIICTKYYTVNHKELPLYNIYPDIPKNVSYKNQWPFNLYSKVMNIYLTKRGYSHAFISFFITKLHTSGNLKCPPKIPSITLVPWLNSGQLKIKNDVGDL